ncbi:MAG TPA: TetR/AcrR family transcriptional regulator [Ktedonosporobacter sp.]|nr:TetR/AcrR family transcriptional regulator [Ktedonosporobacter sp.]
MSAKAARDVRREEITAAAGDLFSRKGFHGTSVPDIARAAGISTGLIYHIFANKEDILLACCEKTAALHLDLFKQGVDIADPLERFDFIVRELYKDLDKGSKGILVTYRDSSTLPREMRHRIIDMIKNLDNQFLALFQEGQCSGAFRPDIPELRVLAANVLGLGHLWALQKTWHFLPTVDLETYTSTQLDYFHSQLLCKARDTTQPDAASCSDLANG